MKTVDLLTALSSHMPSTITLTTKTNRKTAAYCQISTTAQLYATNNTYWLSPVVLIELKCIDIGYAHSK